MVAVIIGGSGSGKSEYAESLAVQYTETQLVYIATMQPFDKESIKRVERHQKMRKEKHFETIESYTNLEKIRVLPKTTILLECMSNLIANEMFSDSGTRQRANINPNSSTNLETNTNFETNTSPSTGEIVLDAVKKGIKNLIQQTDNLIIVTNNVFEDGSMYDFETLEYLKILGEINQWISVIADQVIEVVHGIPIDLYTHQSVDRRA